MEFPDFDFARLIHPIESATFKRAYWERRPLVISRADPGYYRGLLTLAHLIAYSPPLAWVRRCERSAKAAT